MSVFKYTTTSLAALAALTACSEIERPSNERAPGRLQRHHETPPRESRSSSSPRP